MRNILKIFCFSPCFLITKSFKLLIFSLLLIVSISGVFPQNNNPAPQKFALVIGNSNYSAMPKLANPVNDASDMASALQGLGFTVDKLLNADIHQMENAVSKFKIKLAAAESAYGFFYYAGHGIQSNGDNYLLPVDADIPSENYLRDRAISVQAILGELNDAGNSLNIVVLDACRDNALSWSRGGNRGLVAVSHQPADSIIVYATSAGSTAADGDGRNGLFTSQLLKNLKTPGLDVSEVFRLTGADVTQVSGRRQIPAVYNQFFGIAYLGEKPAVPVQPEIAPAPEASEAIGGQISTIAFVPVQETSGDTNVIIRNAMQNWVDKTPNLYAASRLWSLGVSMGYNSFNLIDRQNLYGNIKGTIAPANFIFLEIGLAIGLTRLSYNPTMGFSNDPNFSSFYPYINVAYYIPPGFFKSGIYAGAGCGYMNYNFSEYDRSIFDTKTVKTSFNGFGVNLFVGVLFFDWLELSYTMYFVFGSVSNKIAENSPSLPNALLSIGYTYHFKQRIQQ